MDGDVLTVLLSEELLHLTVPLSVEMGIWLEMKDVMMETLKMEMDVQLTAPQLNSVLNVTWALFQVKKTFPSVMEFVEMDINLDQKFVTQQQTLLGLIQRTLDNVNQIVAALKLDGTV